MAFRNSVKATLLLEPEQPRSRSDEPRATVEAPAPAPPPLAQRASENVAQRASENTAQRPLENIAKQAAIAPPPAADDALLAAAWHARAEELCAMADTLRCETSWSLISKIAKLYDELARDAGWTEPDAFAPGDVRLEEPQALAPPAEPRPPERVAFPRRPLPLGRLLPRRRA